MSFFSAFILYILKVSAQLQLNKNSPTIIGVTGSAGKSSAVRAIYAAIKNKQKVKASFKGNSETGIPFEILSIPVDTYNGVEWIRVLIQAIWKLFTNWEKYDVLILEMGIDSEKPPKNMEYLLSIVQPHIGVFLSVNSVHGANFSGENIIQSIANEKGKILTQLPLDGVAIFSLDYPEIVKLQSKISANKQTFSIGKKNANIYLTNYSVSLKGTTFKFGYDGNHYSLHLPNKIFFKETFGTFASAILVAHTLGISVEEVCDSLAKEFTLLPGRMSVIKGKNNTTILDSSYNSSLSPTSGALKMLKEFSGRKVAILGDMRELGKQTKADHESLAKIASETADVIVLVGPQTKSDTLPMLEKLKFDMKHVFSFTNAYEALTAIDEIIRKGDLILVKGSQNTIFLEIIVKHLMADPSQAKKLLPRQTEFWELQRQKLKKILE